MVVIDLDQIAETRASCVLGTGLCPLWHEPQSLASQGVGNETCCITCKMGDNVCLFCKANAAVAASITSSAFKMVFFVHL